MMRLSALLGPDLKAVLEADPKALREALEEFHPEDISEIVDDLPRDDAIALIRALDTEVAADVVERLEPRRQVRLLQAIAPERAVELLVAMDPDDRVDLIQELPDDEAALLLTRLAEKEPEAAEEVRELVLYGPDTAGGLMTTEFISLEPDMKVWQAIDEVRRLGREGIAELIYYVYVSSYNKLLGVLSLRDLILSDPGVEIGALMEEQVVFVDPMDDQEKVAEIIARYDLAAVPVVDDREGLIGVVTVDDVVDVVIEEATEDAQMMGGVVPLENSYFDTGLFEFVWKRGAWLVLLFVAQMLTATVMERSSDILAATVQLVIFIPLIISSGGNSGSQSSTLVIRAMAVGELDPSEWRRVLGRELSIGLLLGLLLGAIGFARAFMVGSVGAPLRLGLAVGGSVIAVVTLGTLVGSLLPLAIRRVGLDPAVSSTPFIASVVDVLGLVVYLSLAHWIMIATL